LSFDDGYSDLYEHAFPLLRQEGLPAIIYLVTDHREDAWRRTKSLLPLQLLNWAQIREMADSGITFGSHTRTHSNLTRCTPEQLHDEVLNSKKIIEDKLSKQVQHFCYPFGKTNDQVVDMVREAGYITACTTRPGRVLRGTDSLRLPRLKVGKRMGLLKFFMRMTLKS
jgi:peptidoglycan/xylan/chitin deacetylase (PgdA/CDA1 family)